LTSISVVVPTRNRSRLLQTTLLGILASRDVDLEVVVVDDGSTDDTQRCVAALGDPRVRVLRHDESRGVVTARNAGIEVADGTWLGFCDDDDLWAPEKLVEQLRAAAHSERRWAVAGAVGFEVDGTIRNVNNPPTGPELTALLPWLNGIPGGCSNVVVRRDLLRDTGGFDPRLRVLADWELWIRLARREPPATVSSPLVGYRLHASNMSNDSRGVYAEFRLVEQLSHDLRGGLPIEPHWFHHWVAHAALRARRRRTAAVGYARAATLADPKPLLASAAALMLSERGWKQVRRLRNRRRPRPPAPPWLDELLARERQSQPE
jgi:glycosyltransferase involved in cell wall biosynthesis